MSEQRPFASEARTRPKTTSIALEKTPRNDKEGQQKKSDRYSVQYLFTVILTIFSSVPTTIFLAWVIVCGTVILFLCTLTFAVALTSVVGLSLFVYGPVFCFCVISALTCSILYGFTFNVWDTFHRLRYALYHLWRQVFVLGTSTTMAASDTTGENEAASTSWRSPPWQPAYPPLAVSPTWSRPESPTLGMWDQQRQQLLSNAPANRRNGIAVPEDPT